jgi:hypothetical protein
MREITIGDKTRGVRGTVPDDCGKSTDHKLGPLGVRYVFGWSLAEIIEWNEYSDLAGDPPAVGRCEIAEPGDLGVGCTCGVVETVPHDETGDGAMLLEAWCIVRQLGKAGLRGWKS